MPHPSDLHDFRWKIHCDLMDLNWCSPIGHVSFLWLLSKIWFVFGFQKFNYDASWPEFLWVYSVCSASWICRFVCFLGHVWRVFSHISLNNLSATLSSSILRLWWFECWIFCNYSPHPGGSAHFFFFFLVFSLHCFSCAKSINLCSNSLIVSSIIFTLSLSSSTEVFFKNISVIFKTL